MTKLCTARPIRWRRVGSNGWVGCDPTGAVLAPPIAVSFWNVNGRETRRGSVADPLSPDQEVEAISTRWKVAGQGPAATIAQSEKLIRDVVGEHKQACAADTALRGKSGRNPSYGYNIMSG